MRFTLNLWLCNINGFRLIHYRKRCNFRGIQDRTLLCADHECASTKALQDKTLFTAYAVCWRRRKSVEKWRRKLVSTQICLPWSQRGFVTRIDCCSLWAASRVRSAGLSPALDPTHRAYFVPAFSPPPDIRGNRQPLTPVVSLYKSTACSGFRTGLYLSLTPPPPIVKLPHVALCLLDF